MIFDLVIVCVAILALTVGSITDLKKREVADWITYGLVVCGLGLRLVYSAYVQDWWPIVFGVIGACAMYGLALLMYYTGQWGGGDAKMLFGLGALCVTYTPLFFSPIFGDHLLPSFNWVPPDVSLLFLIAMFLNILIVGAVYGVCWTLGLFLLHAKTVTIHFCSEQKNKTAVIILCACLLVLALFAVFVPSIYVPLLFYLMIILFLFIVVIPVIKIVEKVGMIKLMKTQEITEGEWVLDHIVYANHSPLIAAGTTLTKKLLTEFDSSPPIVVTVQKKSLFSQRTLVVPLSDVGEDVVLQKTFKHFPTEKKLSFEQKKKFMHEVLREKSRYATIKATAIFGDLVLTPRCVHYTHHSFSKHDMHNVLIKGYSIFGFDLFCSFSFRSKQKSYSFSVGSGFGLKRKILSAFASVDEPTESARVHFSQLREHDIFAEATYTNPLEIVPKKHLGVDRYQIALLQQYYTDPVRVKLGIPFLPAFLLGYVLTLVAGNILFYVPLLL